jgi:hypothetical protein
VAAIQLHEPCLMDEQPQDGERVTWLEVHGIEDIVPCCDGDGERKNCVERQPDQSGENNHANADGPYHLEKRDIVIPLKEEPKPNQRYFEKDKPQSPCEQEGRHLAFASPLLPNAH